MEIQTESFSTESHSRFEILSATPEVEATIEDLGVTDGLVYAPTLHTSAALPTNEYEEKLFDDMIDKFKQIAPLDDGYYHDLDRITVDGQPNTHTHLISAMIKRPVPLALCDGELDLGIWEEVMFFELCGPRERTITTTTLR